MEALRCFGASVLGVADFGCPDVGGADLAGEDFAEGDFAYDVFEADVLDCLVDGGVGNGIIDLKDAKMPRGGIEPPTRRFSVYCSTD